MSSTNTNPRTDTNVNTNSAAPDGWERLSDEETREMIRRGAQEMGGLVRTTLGPDGRDKMVVRRMSDTNETLRSFVSNDGIAILEEFEGETSHPVANQFIRFAEDHEDDYGDGSTAAVVLASELLQTGMDLIDDGIAPIDVVEGFSIGAQRTLEVWEDASIPLTTDDSDQRTPTGQPASREAFDRDRLEAVAWSAMTNGREGEWALEGLVPDVVEATLRAWEPERGTVDISYVRTEAIPGGDTRETEMIPGSLLPYDPMAGEHLLPVDGGVLLVHGDLRARGVRSRTLSVAFDDATVADSVESETEAIAESIADAGAAAVFVAGDVTAKMGAELARHGVPCFRNVKRFHLELLSRITGSEIRGPVTRAQPARAEDLARGSVRYVEAQGEKTWLEVTAPEEAEPQTVGLVVRGGTESVASEAERRIKSGLNATRAAIKHPTALPGGGAVDLEAANEVRTLAPRFDGREQLAVEAFADVLEVIPRTLATNAGHDPIDAMVDLRTRHAAGHSHAGIDADGRLVDDTVAASDALDAFLIRASGLIRGVEFANSLMSIDNVLIDHRPPIDLEDLPGYR